MPPTSYCSDKEVAALAEAEDFARRLQAELVAMRAQNEVLREKLQEADQKGALLDKVQHQLQELEHDNGELAGEVRAERQRAMEAIEMQLVLQRRVTDLQSDNEHLQRRLQILPSVEAEKQEALKEVDSLRQELRVAKRFEVLFRDLEIERDRLCHDEEGLQATTRSLKKDRADLQELRLRDEKQLEELRAKLRDATEARKWLLAEAEERLRAAAAAPPRRWGAGLRGGDAATFPVPGETADEWDPTLGGSGSLRRKSVDLRSEPDTSGLR